MTTENTENAEKGITMRYRKEQRSGLAMMELSVCVAILALMIPMVAQLAFWSMMNRAQVQSRQTAQELANNVLESARACSWEELTVKWARAQKIPDDLKSLLPEGTLTVNVEPMGPGICQVTAIVTWRREVPGPPHEVRLSTLLGPRKSNGGGI